MHMLTQKPQNQKKIYMKQLTYIHTHTHEYIKVDKSNNNNEIEGKNEINENDNPFSFMKILCYRAPSCHQHLSFMVEYQFIIFYVVIPRTFFYDISHLLYSLRVIIIITTMFSLLYLCYYLYTFNLFSKKDECLCVYCFP